MAEAIKAGRWKAHNEKSSRSAEVLYAPAGEHRHSYLEVILI